MLSEFQDQHVVITRRLVSISRDAFVELAWLLRRAPSERQLHV